MYYAYLDDNGYCHSIGHLSEEIEENNNTIKIDNINENYIDRKYDLLNKIWTDEYFKFNKFESNKIEISEQELYNTNLLINLEYIKTLLEINNEI